MAKTLTDRQFAEIESSILTLRNRAERLMIKYAEMVGIDREEYAADPIFYATDPIYDTLNAAYASLEEAYELLE